jgi:hypothetical protein
LRGVGGLPSARPRPRSAGHSTIQDGDWETPGDIRDLRRAEHLLVRSLRAIAVGHGDCPRLHHAFEPLCGPQGGHALMTFFTLVRMIGVTGRRGLRLNAPGCVCLSCDERAMLAVIAAAQDGLRTGEIARLEAHLHWLVEGEPDPIFIHAANVVAEILEANGQRLPLRLRGDEGLVPETRDQPSDQETPDDFRLVAMRVVPAGSLGATE